jgi:hypothetical protein
MVWSFHIRFTGRKLQISFANCSKMKKRGNTLKTIEIEVSDKLAQQLQMAKNIYGEPYASEQIRNILGRWAHRVLVGSGRPSLFQIGMNAFLEVVEVGVKEQRMRRLNELPPSQISG